MVLLVSHDQLQRASRALYHGYFGAIVHLMMIRCHSDLVSFYFSVMKLKNQMMKSSDLWMKMEHGLELSDNLFEKSIFYTSCVRYISVFLKSQYLTLLFFGHRPANQIT